MQVRNKKRIFISFLFLLIGIPLIFYSLKLREVQAQTKNVRNVNDAIAENTLITANPVVVQKSEESVLVKHVIALGDVISKRLSTIEEDILLLKQAAQIKTNNGANENLPPAPAGGAEDENAQVEKRDILPGNVNVDIGSADPEKAQGY